jgi:hypothetical protein
MAFDSDLEKGRVIEKYVADAYSSKTGNPCLQTERGNHSPWDLCLDLSNDIENPKAVGCCHKRIEVKFDLVATQFKSKDRPFNLYFEIAYSGRSSGIINTLCDEWIHVVGKHAFVFDIRELRALFYRDVTHKDKIGKILGGGDRNQSVGWAVPYDKIKTFVKKNLTIPEAYV